MPDTTQPVTTPTEVPDRPQSETPAAATTTATRELVEADLLVEDVSIDGMCGVY